MHHRLDPVLTEQLGEPVGIVQARLDERRSRVNRGAVAGAEVVYHHHLMPEPQERFDCDAADVAGAAGDEDVHGR